MALFVVPGAEIFQEDLLGGFEHAVFVMHAVKRIVAAVSTIRKRCAEWINIQHLKASSAHRPGRVCIVQLYLLQEESMFKNDSVERVSSDGIHDLISTFLSINH